MNRLSREKSPYLRQHADNPVDWYPWGEEAFARARAEGKPIFLSVGYSTCHWCHVMERESFANEATARLMNESFVNVKLDREERPDVDRVYMAFVQASTGGGGWPMSVFLTPSLEPFYGGTYFPPQDAHGRPGFPTLLRRIGQLWQEKRAELTESATRILGQIAESEALPGTQELGPEVVETAFAAFRKLFDAEYAGFGGAPKFPRPVVYDFLFAYHARTGEALAADMALATLVLMSRGGMYDHLGGGFHRYSVDRHWHVPHFEKMLYDQAQLVHSYVEGWQLTHDPDLARIALETCAYVIRDLTAPDGGFYSAEDADSLPPGVTDPHHKKEGAFYVWSRAELDQRLGADADLFCRAYAVEPDGNAEDPHGELTGMNVLHSVSTPQALAEDTKRTAQEVEQALAAARETLFAARADRARPSRDEKVLAAWNGMMIGALARASSALVEPGLLRAAQRAATFAATTLWNGERLFRRWADGETAIDGYLDDHAQLAAGLLDLYEADFDPRWLLLAETLVDRAILRFGDEAGGFYATSGEDKSVLLRMKDDYDGAEPSGNAVMAMTLLRLAEMLDRPELRRRAEGVFAALSSRLKEIPHAVPALVTAWDFARTPPLQIVIAGEPDAADTHALLRVVRGRHLPHKVVLLADARGRAALGARLPWVAAMSALGGKATAYVCKDKACERPTTDLAELASLLPARQHA